jgi:hypothetical protein
LAAILCLTLRPGPDLGAATTSGGLSAYDVVLNILLFLPLGAGLVLLGLRLRSAILFGALTSTMIELAQRWWVAGRYASIYDVAANSLGCALGVLVVTRWADRGRWWPKVAPPLALAIVLGWFLGGYLAQPAIPGPSPWTARWASVRDDATAFEGEVLDVHLQGAPLPDGPVAELPVLRARLSASRKTMFEATIVAGPPAAGHHRIVEIVVGEGTVPFLVLEQEGGALRAYQRLGLSWVGLRGPWLTLEHALSNVAGDTIRVRLEATRRHLRLTAARGGIERQASIRLAPELYFGALLSRAIDGSVWWNLLPAVASFVLLGFALANRPKALVVVGLAALFLSAVGGGCALPAWPVALLAVAGAVMGRTGAMRLQMFGG